MSHIETDGKTTFEDPILQHSRLFFQLFDREGRWLSRARCEGGELECGLRGTCFPWQGGKRLGKQIWIQKVVGFRLASERYASSASSVFSCKQGWSFCGG